MDDWNVLNGWLMALAFFFMFICGLVAYVTLDNLTIQSRQLAAIVGTLFVVLLGGTSVLLAYWSLTLS